MNALDGLTRRISGNRPRAALAVLLVLAGVLIDLRFAAHPALSIGLLLAAAAVIAIMSLLSSYREVPMRRLRVGLASAVVLCLGGAVVDLMFSADPALSVPILVSIAALFAAVAFLIPSRAGQHRAVKP
jgi:hypothetical protein